MHYKFSSVVEVIVGDIDVGKAGEIDILYRHTKAVVVDISYSDAGAVVEVFEGDDVEVFVFVEGVLEGDAGAGWGNNSNRGTGLGSQAKNTPAKKNGRVPFKIRNEIELLRTSPI